MNWRQYHESTKHTVERLNRSPHLLDWNNMPDPFRHYEGAPVLDLPADPSPPGILALDLLLGAYGATAAKGPEFLSQLMFHTAAISASKRVPSTGYRYALRVNPSSGNLHPTEFHFLARGLRDWPDGLYHYRPSQHMAERRASGNLTSMWGGTMRGLLLHYAPIVFVLTSIAWREAWKYGNRAYRYCLHDMGHAWQALSLAARAFGCDTFAIGDFRDDEVARSCRFHEDEWPMLIVTVRAKASAPSIAICEDVRNDVRDVASETAWTPGCANELSPQPADFPLIDAIHAVTKLTGHDRNTSAPEQAPRTQSLSGPGMVLPAPASSARPFGEVARSRRSALDFRGGTASISLAQLAAILKVTKEPLASDFGDERFIQLYMYVHRVDGLDPGVYRYWPTHGALEHIRSGDQRVAAAGLSLGQDLAGNACVAFSMIADLDRATHAHGDRGYRYAHFEAGAIGHRLYLAAEALGLGATGIGAFFDDQVHNYLGITPERGQVVYHFAIGHPVPDPRLTA